MEVSKQEKRREGVKDRKREKTWRERERRDKNSTGKCQESHLLTELSDKETDIPEGSAVELNRTFLTRPLRIRKEESIMRRW